MSIMKKSERKKSRKLSKQIRKIEIEESSTYQSIETIKTWMDEYYLDAIIGLIPVVGDAITKLFSLPFIYVALFKVRSIPLTLAIIFNILLDFLLGSIPYMIGNVVDFFFRSYNNNFKLIVGFVEDDRQIIRKVNEKAILMGIGISAIVYLIYLFVSAMLSLYSWFFSLFDFL